MNICNFAMTFIKVPLLILYKCKYKKNLLFSSSHWCREIILYIIVSLADIISNVGM